MKRILAALLTVASILVIPSPVVAGEPAMSCDYNPANHQVTMNLIGEQPMLLVSRDALGHINLNGYWCEGTATVTNTDKIAITADGDLQTLALLLANKGFRPGFTNEPGKSDEIEITIDLGPGSDTFYILGSDGVQKIDLGQGNTPSGITQRFNLNSGEGTGVDRDMTVANVETFAIDGSGGNDIVRAQGKRASGPDPFGLPLEIHGGEGNDLIRGGAAGDNIFGDNGVDQVYGNGGPDTIHLIDSAGGDVGHGGPGTDTCEADPGDTCFAD